MKVKTKIRKLFWTLAILLMAWSSMGQNVVVTDDKTYEADASAMLDVKSNAKGLLIPRLSNEEREKMETPATGLLVFDYEDSKFYYFDGTDWRNVAAEGIWFENGSYVYPANTNARVSIGGTSSFSKLEVRADASFGPNDTLFVVKDASGNPVFAVFPDGAKLFVNEGTKGNLGGFAVSGRTPGKTIEEDYLVVTPDSTRVYLQQSAKGYIGGFAVSGRTPGSKITPEDYLIVTADSTRVYVNETAKGNIGGFAVSGRTPGGKLGGGTKFLDVNNNNYFIGHGSGINNHNGMYNSFLGFEAGKANTDGDMNVFLGYQSGYANDPLGSTNEDFSSNNVFIGFEAGWENTQGYDNVFVGTQSGYNNTVGYQNVFMGSLAGYNNSSGDYNTAIGYYAGVNTNKGDNNVMIGKNAGVMNREGNNNVYIGNEAGYAVDAGEDNVLIGRYSGGSSNGGVSNSFYGAYTGQNNSGSYNTYIGFKSGLSTSTGVNNVALGAHSMENLATTASNNVVLGYESGKNLLSNSGNVFIGYQAGMNEQNSNRLMIENSSAGPADALIYGKFDENTLTVNGKLGINTLNPTFDVDILGDPTMATLFIGPDNPDLNNSSEIFLSETKYTMHGTRLRYNGTNRNFEIYNRFNNTDYGPHLVVETFGYVGINTDNPDKYLHVAGDARITGSIYYGTGTSVYTKPDFVFDKDYSEKFTIEEVETFIKQKGHLPWITPLEEETDGINFTRMGFETLEALENMQLQIIELKKQNEELKELIRVQKELIEHIMLEQGKNQ